MAFLFDCKNEIRDQDSIDVQKIQGRLDVTGSILRKTTMNRAEKKASTERYESDQKRNVMRKNKEIDTSTVCCG